jgi:hypothetical protein
MLRRTAARLLIAAGAAAIMVTTAVAPASASGTVGNWALVGQAYSTCVTGASYVYPSNGNGGAETVTFAEENDARGLCEAIPVTEPAGYMANEIVYYKWTGSAWSVCLDSGYYYNGAPYYTFWLYWDSFSTPPCGDGYYGNFSASYVFDHQWQGGSVWSGYEYFPTSPGPRPYAAAAPSRPAWVRADGTVDMARLPARIPVVGKSGTITGYTSLRRPALSPAQAARAARTQHGAGIHLGGKPVG